MLASQRITPEELSRNLKGRWAKAKADAALVEELRVENKELGIENQRLMQGMDHLQNELRIVRDNYEAMKSMALALVEAGKS